jgi:hypothetical protein
VQPDDRRERDRGDQREEERALLVSSPSENDAAHEDGGCDADPERPRDARR